MASVKPMNKGAVMNATAARTHTRELAARKGDGLAVVLLWNPQDGAVIVSVADDRTGDRFEIVVSRERALDAFYHPFAYAPREASHVVCV
jgi:alkanesulfonate monooxygenase SsuD/methylene tetrahydromethanopterin reductase-like flavin-dependent oxidoreductase (luciferase family)